MSSEGQMPVALAELADRPRTLPEVIAWTYDRMSVPVRELLRDVVLDPAALDLEAVRNDLEALKALNLITSSGAVVTTHSAIRPIAAPL
jgi:hypothetical protein